MSAGAWSRSIGVGEELSYPLLAKSGEREQMPLSVPSLATQRRQSDAGGVEAAVDRENLPCDVARAVAAQEEHRLCQFFFEAVAVERDRVVIVGADLRG